MRRWSAAASSVGVTATLEGAADALSRQQRARAVRSVAGRRGRTSLRPARDLRRANDVRAADRLRRRPAVRQRADQRNASPARSARTMRSAIVPTPRRARTAAAASRAGIPSIAFSNPLDPKSIAGAVTISPAPACGEDARQRAGSIEHDRDRPVRARSRRDVHRDDRRRREGHVRSDARARRSR